MDVLIDLGDLGPGEAERSGHPTAWVDLTEPVALTDDALVVVTGNDFTKDMLETKLRPVQQALADQPGTASPSRSSSTTPGHRKSRRS